MFEYFLIVVFILIMDFIWLMVNSSNYNYLIEKVQKIPLSLNFYGAILSYLTLIFGLFFFSIPMIESRLKKNNLLLLCILYGGGLGILMYGMFNSTNIGIFKNYDYRIGLLDTFWGFIIFTMSSYIFFLIKKKWFKFLNN